jgi:hypothetical protein
MLSFLTGVLIKVYDDFVDDIPVLTNAYVVASLRTLLPAALALCLAGDLWLWLGFTLFNSVCAWSDWSRYSGPHDVSLWPLTALCLTMSWKHRPPLGQFDAGIVIGLLGVALFEPIAFPEETSVLKGLSRFWGAWSLFTAALVLRRIGASARSLLWMFGGYSLASSMAQMLRLCEPHARHEDQGVHEDVHAPPSRLPRRVPNENLPELRRGVNPEGAPHG